jgi:hypothetical protein
MSDGKRGWHETLRTGRHPLQLLLSLGVHPSMGPRESARRIAFNAASVEPRHRVLLRAQVISCGYPADVFDAVVGSVDEMQGRAT